MSIGRVLIQVRPADRPAAARFVHHRDRYVDEPLVDQQTVQRARRFVLAAARAGANDDFDGFLRLPLGGRLTCKECRAGAYDGGDPGFDFHAVNGSFTAAPVFSERSIASEISSARRASSGVASTQARPVDR